MTLHKQSVILFDLLFRWNRVVFPQKSLPSFSYSLLVYGGPQMIAVKPSKENFRTVSTIIYIKH